MKLAWLFWMAWRDSRRSRSRLLLYTCSIVLGVAALVAVSSLSRNLADAVEAQSRGLLGADVSFSRNQPFTEADKDFFSTIGEEYSDQISFASMAYFPESEMTRLVRVRAIQEGYPYYGTFETDPEDAPRQLRQGAFALVEEGLLLQAGAQPGDAIKIGDLTLTVAGKLLRTPGESLSFSNIGARVYMPYELAEETGLIQFGSRVRYTRFFKLPPPVEAEKLLEAVEEERRELGLSVESVQERREEFGSALENLSSFLSLIGLVALILGGLGVASAIHVYVKTRLNTVAILRCVGATPAQCLAVYSIQAVAIGLVGSIVGIGLGYVTQRLLHRLVSSILPLQVNPVLHWISAAEGLLLGLSFSLLFTLIPLVKIRNISPLLALRADFEPEGKRKRDPLVVLLYALIAAIIFGFSILEAGRFVSGAGFFLG
ncbi:MAG TPA: FtsX-like permease family protein, partial [Acidobacteriota bacterium]|nr:FtsX-like permease family protein [Acidobacteriota bacterium]